jgi:hypothetical protein
VSDQLFTIQALRKHYHLSEKDHEVVREEARELMRHIQEKCIEYDPDCKVRGRHIFTVYLLTRVP